MFGVKFLKSRSARSILYLITIGGLFSIMAGGILFIWNNVFKNVFNISNINILEALGIASILYIILFSVKFGLVQDKENCRDKVDLKETKPESNNLEIHKLSFFASLTKSEKEKLISSLQKCCGNITDFTSTKASKTSIL